MPQLDDIEHSGAPARRPSIEDNGQAVNAKASAPCGGILPSGVPSTLIRLRAVRYPFHGNVDRFERMTHHLGRTGCLEAPVEVSRRRFPSYLRGFDSRRGSFGRLVAHNWPTYCLLLMTIGDNTNSGIFLRSVFSCRQLSRV